LWRSQTDFEAWTRSEAFRLAHRDAGQNRPLYLGHPEFEGFEIIQTIEA
jgi:heme-degrading monooxygenase HmoA